MKAPLKYPLALLLLSNCILNCISVGLLSVGARVASATQILDRVLVVIGDKAILQSDLDKNLFNIKRTPALATAFRLDPKDVTSDKLLERMIEEKIIQQVVKEKGLEVTDADVDKQISGIAQQNHIGIEDLKRSLLGEGIPFDVYKQNIRGQLERRNLFDRELRSGGGVSEAELRSLYDRKAGVEMDMHLVTLKKTPENQAKLEDLVAQVRASKLSPDKALKKVPSQSLGWLKTSDLNPALKKTLGNLSGDGAAGPVVSGKNLQVLVVTASRKGSEEEFTQVKDTLMSQAQSEDFEKRFAIWLERKKEEMQILRNKI